MAENTCICVIQWQCPEGPLGGHTLILPESLCGSSLGDGRKSGEVWDTEAPLLCFPLTVRSRLLQGSEDS